MQAAADVLFAAVGRIDVLVNNAAWVRYQSIPDIDVRTLDRMLNVGFNSVIWGIQVAAALMHPERGGTIINIASAAGIRSAPNTLVTAESKRASWGSPARPQRSSAAAISGSTRLRHPQYQLKGQPRTGQLNAMHCV